MKPVQPHWWDLFAPVHFSLLYQNSRILLSLYFTNGMCKLKPLPLSLMHSTNHYVQRVTFIISSYVDHLQSLIFFFLWWFRNRGFFIVKQTSRPWPFGTLMSLVNNKPSQHTTMHAGCLL